MQFSGEWKNWIPCPILLHSWCHCNSKQQWHWCTAHWNPVCVDIMPVFDNAFIVELLSTIFWPTIFVWLKKWQFYLIILCMCSVHSCKTNENLNSNFEISINCERKSKRASYSPMAERLFEYETLWVYSFGMSVDFTFHRIFCWKLSVWNRFSSVLVFNYISTSVPGVFWCWSNKK